MEQDPLSTPDLPSGNIHGSFPSQGTLQPAYKGSQSTSPNKYDADQPEDFNPQHNPRTGVPTRRELIDRGRYY